MEESMGFKRNDFVYITKNGNWNPEMEYLLVGSHQIYRIKRGYAYFKGRNGDHEWAVKFKYLSPSMSPETGGNYSINLSDISDLDFSLIEVTLQDPVKVIEHGADRYLVITCKFLDKYEAKYESIADDDKKLLHTTKEEVVYEDDFISVLKVTGEDLKILLAFFRTLKRSPWINKRTPCTVKVKTVKI